MDKQQTITTKHQGGLKHIARDTPAAFARLVEYPAKTPRRLRNQVVRIARHADPEVRFFYPYGWGYMACNDYFSAEKPEAARGGAPLVCVFSNADAETAFASRVEQIA